MLKHIPFYASLLGREMSNNKKSNNGMVLVYGAIEVHAMGEKGCIASNKRIADETGLSAGTVANYISELNRSGWVKVVTKNINGGIARLEIKPLLTIETHSRKNDALHTSVIPPSSGDDTPLHLGVIPPSSGDDTPLHLGVNIGNNIDNKENTSLPKGKGETPKKMTNLDIDHLMEYWEITVGYAIQGKKQANRYACNNLIKKLTVAGVEQVINGVALAHGDKYAPKISDFCSLQAKLNDLILWGKNYGNNKSFIKI